MGVSARSVFINLDNAGGSLVDLSQYFNSIDDEHGFGQDEDTTFGAAVEAKSFHPTLFEGGFTLEAPYHQTLSTHLSGLEGLATTSTIEIGMEGNGATKEKITGECRLESVKRAGKVGGLGTIVATFKWDQRATGLKPQYTTF